MSNPYRTLSVPPRRAEVLEKEPSLLYLLLRDLDWYVRIASNSQIYFVHPKYFPVYEIWQYSAYFNDGLFSRLVATLGYRLPLPTDEIKKLYLEIQDREHQKRRWHEADEAVANAKDRERIIDRAESYAIKRTRVKK